MYVWSTGDEFIRPVAARAAERFVTAPYRFEVLDGVSHWISEEAPERLAALIVGWLGEW
jgi:pimeloyl-ACP methyl ester carboxylesterase